MSMNLFQMQHANVFERDFTFLKWASKEIAYCMCYELKLMLCHIVNV